MSLAATEPALVADCRASVVGVVAVSLCDPPHPPATTRKPEATISVATRTASVIPGRAASAAALDEKRHFCFAAKVEQLDPTQLRQPMAVPKL